MRRLVIIIVVLIVVGAGVCVGGSLLVPKLIKKPSSTPTTVETPVAAGSSVVRARGNLVPGRVETLSFSTSGTVGQLTVEVDDEVSAGQVIARLDTTDLEWAVRQAEDALTAARLTYSQTVKTASPEDIASAEATLASAEAGLASAEAGLVSAEAGLVSAEAGLHSAEASLVSAEASLVSAQESLVGAQTGLISARTTLTDAVRARDALEDTRAAAEAGLESTQASLASAQASLAALRAGPDETAVEIARLNWEIAKNSLWQAQLNRDAIQPQPVLDYQKDLAEASVGAAEFSARISELQYQQAQEGATEEALAAARASVAAAESGVINAQAQVDGVDDEVAQAEASVAQAQANVTQAEANVTQTEANVTQTEASVTQTEASVTQAEASLTQAEAREAQAKASVLQAEASVSQAQAALDQLRAGPDELAVAQATLKVHQAEAELERAKAHLLDVVEIRAPFDGVVSAVSVEKGSPIAAGAPVVTVADLSSWKVETEDLDEWGVTRIATDEAITLVFTAFDDKSLTGHIEEIDFKPTDLPTGDVAYKVTITLDEFDPALRWGMSARVEFPKSE
jgi:HlyD family secretion protein